MVIYANSDHTSKRLNGGLTCHASPNVKLEKHREFYFEDGSLIIQVENVLFRVFKTSLIRCSPIFADILSLPAAGPERFAEGSCDENPFVLDGISQVDFERFLTVIYLRNFGKYDLSTVAEWLSVLELAARWDVASMRKLAISQVESLLDANSSPVDRVVIAQRYRITDTWSRAAYAALCNRPKSLSIEEAARLGVETSTRISTVREKLLRRQVGGRKASISAPPRTKTIANTGPSVSSRRQGAKSSDNESDSSQSSGSRSRSNSVGTCAGGRQLGRGEDRLPTWAAIELNIAPPLPPVH